MENRPRLLSLDLFRGFTILAMIIVNNPGSWDTVYAPLLHAKWHGITPTDLIFPFFLFIVGVAIHYALGSARVDPSRRKQAIYKIIKRSAYLFLIGLFLNAYPDFELGQLRIPGVLQRIAVAFLIVGSLYLYSSRRTQIIVFFGILLVYWVLLTWVPLPTGLSPNLGIGSNWAAWLDSILLKDHMWEITKTWDPEGVLSTLPAIATCLSGLLCAYMIKEIRSAKDLLKLLLFGAACLVVGWLWSHHFPINKSLWTSSFVLFTSGAAILFLGLLYWLFDLLKLSAQWLYPIKAFGINAIFAYVFSTLLAASMDWITIDKSSIHQLLFLKIELLMPNAYFSSLMYALFFTVLVYLPIWALYKKNIILKV